MPAIRSSTTMLRQLPMRAPFAARTFASTSIRAASKDAPPPNKPPSAQKAGRDAPLHHDSQSSASTHETESKGGDEHPARQPDPQPTPESDTGFGNVGGSGGVKGGKEGLHNRSDKPGGSGD